MIKKLLTLAIILVFLITLAGCTQKPKVKFPEFNHDYDDVKKVAIDIGKKAGEANPVVNCVAKSAVNGKATWVIIIEGNFSSPYPLLFYRI